jgi:hypothetical protein
MEFFAARIVMLPNKPMTRSFGVGSAWSDRAPKYRCRTCHTEGQIYRHGQCARCALGEDLTARADVNSTLTSDEAADPPAPAVRLATERRESDGRFARR